MTLLYLGEAALPVHADLRGHILLSYSSCVAGTALGQAQTRKKQAKPTRFRLISPFSEKTWIGAALDIAAEAKPAGTGKPGETLHAIDGPNIHEGVKDISPIRVTRQELSSVSAAAAATGPAINVSYQVFLVASSKSKARQSWGVKHFRQKSWLKLAGAAKPEGMVISLRYPTRWVLYPLGFPHDSGGMPVIIFTVETRNFRSLSSGWHFKRRAWIFRVLF